MTPPTPPLPARDPHLRPRLAALAAALLALLTRLPFAAQRMWDHDSVQFALGVEKYDLAAHHPHPPGYPLYIALLKFLGILGIDSLHAMVGLSILASGIGAGMMVLLVSRLAGEEAKETPHPRPLSQGRGELADGADPRIPEGESPGPVWPAQATGRAESPHTKEPRRAKPGQGSGVGAPNLPAGLFAAALYIFCPLLWFYGELPLLYAVEGGVTVAVAYAAWRMEESRFAFLTACVLFAVVGGLRQSTMVLLAPLFLSGVYRTWRRGRLTPGLFLAGAALGLALVLAWFLPLISLAGGYRAYQRVGAEHFKTLLPQTSILYGAGWGALAHNLTVLAKWAIQGVLPAVAGLAVLAIAAPARLRGGMALVARRLPFLAVWALPPLLFFALFHVTKGGYTLVHLPALLAALALVAAPALGSRALAAGATAAVVVVGVGLFFCGVDRAPEQSRWWFPLRNEWNLGTLRTYERELDDTLATIRQYSPRTTVLVAVELSGTGASGADGFLYSWHRHLQWYLPEYLVVQAVPEEDFALVARGHVPFAKELSQVTLPAETERLLYVLAGPTGNRLPLGMGAVGTHGRNFWLTSVPFHGERRLGPLLLTAPARRKAA